MTVKSTVTLETTAGHILMTGTTDDRLFFSQEPKSGAKRLLHPLLESIFLPTHRICRKEGKGSPRVQSSDHHADQTILTRPSFPVILLSRSRRRRSGQQKEQLLLMHSF